MTKPLAFTAAAVRRAIEGAKSAGLEVGAVSIHPDGTVTVHKAGQAVEPPSAPSHDGEPGPWRFQA